MNLPISNFTKLFSIFNELRDLTDNEMELHLFERLNMIYVNLKNILKKDGLDITFVLSSKSDKKSKRPKKHHRHSHKRSSKSNDGVFKQVYNNGNSFDFVDMDGNKYYLI
jgi:hypothetical protein